MSRLVDRGFERLAEVEERYLAVLFYAVLLAYTLALLWQAVGYSQAARLFPLIVGAPLAGLMAAYIGIRLLEGRIDVRLVGLFDAVSPIDEVATGQAVSRPDRYRREVEMVLWIVGLVVLTWLVGNLVAIAVFVVTFVYVYERSLARALLVAALVFAFIYVLFIRILGASLWRGVIPVGGLLT